MTVDELGPLPNCPCECGCVPEEWTEGCLCAENDCPCEDLTEAEKLATIERINTKTWSRGEDNENPLRAG